MESNPISISVSRHPIYLYLNVSQKSQSIHTVKAMAFFTKRKSLVKLHRPRELRLFTFFTHQVMIKIQDDLLIRKQPIFVNFPSSTCSVGHVAAMIFRVCKNLQGFENIRSIIRRFGNSDRGLIPHEVPWNECCLFL